MAVIPRINRNVARDVSDDYSVVPTDQTIFVDTTDQGVTIELPDAAQVIDNDPFLISWVRGGNPLILAARAGQTLEDESSITLLAPGESRWIKALSATAFKFV